MNIKKKVLAISGSTRKGSSNELILKQLSAAHGYIEFDFYTELAELPHFNPDLDADPLPAQVQSLRNRIQNSDGVLICTPEYIFALPGALKNAIEWLVSTTILQDKPLAFIVASGL